ncbi:PREDICTED: zinc finger protein 281-like [Cyprinodon variegatus]|uniref:zinc finger protein 281-like n=1 Tax=Cyprinodon variegatus TaxID=28743 RepID=UPI0007428CB1|nr:PREDICTED: zinc finger protein 281-like [Cyprinodon variegatus]XP_015230722.1 PREDICTED: zinc finger protein 281-like [Cyprinodon variegatus]
MSIIQDKLGNEFLRNGGMDPNFAPGMLMFSHLPPVTSFTRLASQSVIGELPQEMILKKERDSPPDHQGSVAANTGGFLHSMGIKQERLSELDYRMPLYSGGGGVGVNCPGGGTGKNATDMPDMSFGNQHQNHQNMLLHDLSLSNVRSLGEQIPGRPGKEPKESSGRRGRRSNGDGQGGKARRKRSDPSKGMMLDGDGACLSPNSKPHICEHCNAAFRSSYHLRRHVLIHTGERPFRCSQCNMSFIQKYLLQRHEKIHSGEKPFSCDQCNMRFIQKYHMERHKRTHSGEKPYRCDTCQQFFSRTDRLLKHKRTCGEAIKKVLDPNMLELSESELGQGSYSLSQGNSTTSGRKRGKSKNGEGGERKKKKNASAAASSGGMARDLGLQDFSMEHPSGSDPTMQGRSPKLVFKKTGRKGLDKGLMSLEDGADGQKLLGQKPDAMDHAEASALDNMGLLQGPGGNKPGPTTSSNYDDAMQFVKKRRYLHAVNNDYGAGSLHMASQGNNVIQGSLGPEPTLAMLDSSPLELKHDKSGIPDEVLQSLLDHYSHKPEGPHHDVTFDLSDHPHHVDLQPAAPVTPELEDDSPNGGDKTAVMSEYSKFLLQALERTSHSGPFPSLGPTGPFPLLSSSSSPTGPLFSDKHAYGSSPLDCVYPPAVSSPLPIAPPSSASSSSSSKSHYGLLVGSPSQASYHLSLESTSHQQLTPSQELTEQLEKQHSPGTFNLPPQELTTSEGSKGQQSKTGGSGGASNGSNYPDLSPLNPPKETTYQIENFAQAFGSQFKSGRRTPLSYGSDPGAEVDHRIRTPVSEFSGYTSLLADVSEPVSTGSKTPTSQSFR